MGVIMILVLMCVALLGVLGGGYLVTKRVLPVSGLAMYGQNFSYKKSNEYIFDVYQDDAVWLDIANGSVTIAAHDKSSITVQETIYAQEPVSDTYTYVCKEKNVLHIQAKHQDSYKSRLVYTVCVPQHLLINLDLRVNNGQIDITQVQGSCLIAVDHGAVTARNIDGQLDVKLKAGQIMVVASELAVVKNMDLAVNAGTIKLVISQDHTTAVYADVVTGSITSPWQSERVNLVGSRLQHVAARSVARIQCHIDCGSITIQEVSSVMARNR